MKPLIFLAAAAALTLTFMLGTLAGDEAAKRKARAYTTAVEHQRDSALRAGWESLATANWAIDELRKRGLPSRPMPQEPVPPVAGLYPSSNVVEGVECWLPSEHPWLDWLCSRTHFRQPDGMTIVGHDALMAATREVAEVLEELHTLRASITAGKDPNIANTKLDGVLCLSVIDVGNKDVNHDGCLTPYELERSQP